MRVKGRRFKYGGVKSRGVKSRGVKSRGVKSRGVKSRIPHLLAEAFQTTKNFSSERKDCEVLQYNIPDPRATVCSRRVFKITVQREL